MKKLSVSVLLVALLLSLAPTPCHSQANLLKAGSPLITALSSVPSLSKFTSLLQTPGLDKVLGGILKKPFTLLAPTNDALNSLGASTLTKLANPANISKLASFVKDHIVPGKLDAAGLMKSGLKAASGKALNLGSAKLGDLIGGNNFNAFPIDKVLGT
jgi:uncharacterized surface protein with fasciclin (FAS1) repeats